MFSVFICALVNFVHVAGERALVTQHSIPTNRQHSFSMNHKAMPSGSIFKTTNPKMKTKHPALRRIVHSGFAAVQAVRKTASITLTALTLLIFALTASVQAELRCPPSRAP